MSSRPSTKAALAELARASSTGLLTPELAGKTLGLSKREASMRLAALTRSGWLSRIRRGVYFIVPLEAASDAVTTPEDPWATASLLYRPCYIAGWSAAEQWNLTEQLFRSTFVATTAHIRRRDETYLGASFHLAKVKAERLQGLTVIWRASTRVSVSGPERTIVDAAVNPQWIGGARQLASIFDAYRRGRDADQSKLAAELERHGNGAAAKRLGFLTEQLWPEAAILLQRCRMSKTAGLAKLDPLVSAYGSLVTRWGLWKNVGVDVLPHS